MSNEVFGLLTGGGNLPATMVAAANARGWPVHIVTFNGQPQPLALPEVASTRQFALGQVGHILAHLKANGVTHVALAGHLHKPSILSLKPDATGLKLLARAVIKHDDALLRAVTSFLEEEGFTLVTVADLTPDLLAPKGLLTTSKPTADEQEDIALARSTLAVLGDLDIGQACIVHNGAILGVEAVEGTDVLIQRCATLRAEKGAKKSDFPTGGILVKRAKDMQINAADLPTVGIETLKLLTQYNYRGLCIQASRTLLLNRAEVVAHANAHNLFLLSE
jgi:DUF1009 family protein